MKVNFLSMVKLVTFGLSPVSCCVLPTVFTLTIGVNAEQLDITVGASSTFHDKTKGLMGVFNGNATDDLLPPGENAVALSNSSSEKTIFFGFGEKCTLLFLQKCIRL